jgi:hypothetical protein
METWTIDLDGIRSTLAVVADGLESDQGAALAWLTGDLRRVHVEIEEACQEIADGLHGLVHMEA